ncbi:2-hydroxychromene-2-carboxylate isomerase [Qipengyuania marisflavi]|uniref:2-hydroxychromene-2-carboxylate isomerase n=1 Tax=Qipengyuania marisflavi TaxID=2486356 RepID=A0A5S3PBX0_9SPHN|nr:2-hydroxychromene-2-carboxylate isomerase [Qipengyuania marisflavi]TMM50255.1 2-hydroxychromene-2-carboxylate isomerase [Qipengyuania marisflavi]
MNRTVELIFDLAAPNGYLAYYPLRDIAQRQGAALVVTPVFLGGMHKLTGNSPPMTRDAGVKGKVEYAMLEFQRFVKKHGMDRFRVHPALPFNSILLQRLLVAVSGDERIRLVEALLPAVWERNIDCGDVEMVAAELTAAGFDAAALLQRTQDPAVKQVLADNTAHAVVRGAFGIPTMFVGNEMFFGKERLSQIEDELARV